jgi:hypothetical protein
MAARARSAVLFAGAALDETEVMARYTARALHREWLDSNTPYPEIWSGKAWQSAKIRGPLGQAVDTVTSKVGQHLYLYRLPPFESTEALSGHVQSLWTRHEQVVAVVDDIEALSASSGGDQARAQTANASFANRLSQVAYELHALANGGAAMILTVQKCHEHLVAPAATLSLTLRPEPQAAPAGALAERRLTLEVTKNRIGDTGNIALTFIPGAAAFEEIQ